MALSDRDGSDSRHYPLRSLVTADLHAAPRGPERVSPVGQGTGSNRSLLERQRRRGHWVERLAPLDTWVAPGRCRAFRMVLDHDHPADGKIARAAPSLKISGIRLTVGPAPLSGEHRDEILREAGCDGAAIAALAAAGVT